MKSKTVSILSILGFAVGLASAMLILLFVLQETSHDKCHKNIDRIYLVTEQVDEFQIPYTPYILAPALKSNFPEILSISRISWMNADIKKGNKYIENVSLKSADNDIFEIFTLPFLEGDPETALDDPFSVVISKSAANQYFESQGAYGKILTIRMMEEDIHLAVTGVMEDIPRNSHFTTDFIVPAELAVKYWKQRRNDERFLNDWSAKFGETFLLLPEKYNVSQLEQKLPDFEKTYLPEGYGKIKYHLLALKDVYLRSSHLESSTKQGLLIIYLNDPEFRNRYGSFKDELAKNQNILNVSGTVYGPPYNGGQYMEARRVDDPEQKVIMEGMKVDFNYIETLEFKLVEGRAFSTEFGSDSNSIILNETAVEKLGLVDPVGKMIENRPIIGVLKDYHLHSFHKEIYPTIIDLMQIKSLREVVVRIDSGHIDETMAFIEDKWSEFAPDALSLFIVLVTMSFHTFKAARTNPVDALKYE